MIKKFDYIKDCGIYKDFVWEDQLSEFNERNILYGWNYSGKTTLSRLFAFIGNNQLSPELRDASFQITCDEGIISSKDLDRNFLSIKVFNSDYITENLHWDKNEGINGISFEVGETVKIDQQIVTLKKKIITIQGDEKQKGEIEEYKNDIKEFEKYDKNEFSKEAKRIKNENFNSLIEFTKVHFTKVVQEVESDINSFIISGEVLRQIISNVHSADDKGRVIIPQIALSVHSLIDEVEEILKYIPNVTETIVELSNDNEAYNWVRSGLDLHNHNKRLTCFFCGSDLDPVRLDKLNVYYSNEAAKLKERISKCRENILQFERKNKDLSLGFVKNDLINSLQDKYKEFEEELYTIKKNNNVLFKALLKKLEEKEEALFQIITSFESNLDIDDIIANFFKRVDVVVSQHNIFISEFTKNQKESMRKYKNHIVANYLKNENYFDKKKKSDDAKKKIDILNKSIQECEKKICDLEISKKSISVGKTELEWYICKFLNRDDIKIDITQDEKYILKRNGKIAKNFSDGEKTAISFAYFIIELESLLKEGKLKDTIVFIDDPISSLDANHIAQVYSLINDFFFRKGVKEDNLSEYAMIVKQLFISTHNFEFFSFIRDSTRINKKNKHSYYLIKRLPNQSIITKLPNSLSQYKSEYVYLFSLIYSFYSRNCPEDDGNLLMLPNSIRRFLELYTLMKLPGSREEVDGRLKILCQDYSSLKVLHHFSHFTSLDFVSKHDEKILNLPLAVKELVDILQKDENHFTSLVEATKKEC